MADAPDQEAPDRPGVIRTVLFADIADSSRFLVEVGDERAHEVFRRCLDAMMEAARAENGEVHDEKGDEILALFPDPTGASVAAAAMQLQIGEISQDNPDLPRLSLRIGFEHGSIIQSEEGVFGTTIYVSARLVSLAKSGQILTTKETLELIDEPKQTDTRFFARQVLRGQPQEREIIELLWDPGDSTTWIPRDTPRETVHVDYVEFNHGGTLYRIDAESPRLELGRNPSCDLPILHKAVSRLHARVSWNNGSVQFEDLSTNGTLVEPDTAPSVPLHHDRTRLSGEGVLRVGTLEPTDDAPVVSYRCVRPG